MQSSGASGPSSREAVPSSGAAGRSSEAVGRPSRESPGSSRAPGRPFREPAASSGAAGRGEPPRPSHDDTLFGGPPLQRQVGRGRPLFRRPSWAAAEPGVPPPNVAGGFTAINAPRERRDEEPAGPQFERMQTRSRTRGSSSSSARGSSSASRGSSRAGAGPSSRPQQSVESPRPHITLRMGEPPAQEPPPNKRARVRVSPPPPPPPPTRSMGSTYSPTSPTYSPSPRASLPPPPPSSGVAGGSGRLSRRPSASPGLFMSPVSFKIPSETRVHS